MCQRPSSCRGSITVFVSLLLMLVASVLFTLLEVSRYAALGMTAELNSRNVTESVFAEYNVPAYENYHLLLMDGGYGTGELAFSKMNARMQKLGQESLHPAAALPGGYANFLQMEITDSRIVRYELATDQNCGVLFAQMAQVMKQELAADLLEHAYDSVTDTQQSCNQGERADRYFDNAWDALEQAKEQAAQEQKPEEKKLPRVGSGQTAPPVEETGQVGESVENPMEDVKSAQSSPVLIQVLPDNARISAKQLIDKGQMQCSGNYGAAYKNGAAEKLLAVQYLMKYNCHYKRSIRHPHALSYELEYVLFGKDSDEDNLEKMAGRLLLLREGINFAYLMSDSAKRSEALSLATAIATAAGIPEAASAIQMGLLASWAYAESVAEVRTLFCGEKIAAAKSSSDWTTGLSEVAFVLTDTSRRARAVSNGVDYADYVRIFLCAEAKDRLAGRFAQLLEQNIRKNRGYEKAALDCMLTAAQTETTYRATQRFLTPVTIMRLSGKGYGYQKTYDFSYLTTSGGKK